VIFRARGCSPICPTRRCSCRSSRSGCCWGIMRSSWAAVCGTTREM